VRWSFENEKWIRLGLWAVSLRAHVPETRAEHSEESEAAAATEAVTHSSVPDGVHVSRRIRQFEVGPLVEHLRYREENEWKGGGRVAWASDASSRSSRR
jgi:hypothetical protein